MTNEAVPSTEIADPYLLTGDEAGNLLRNAPWSRFLAIGDSAAEGVTEPYPGYPTQGWVDRTAGWLRQVQPGLTTLNLGRRNLVSTVVRETQLPSGLRFAPDLVAVVAGGNDLLQRAFDLDATRDELVRLVTPFQNSGATVITMGLFDSSVSPHSPEKYRAIMSERIGQLGDMLRELARKLNTVHVDLPAHPARAEEIFTSDGMHLNARGQAIVGDEVVRMLGAHLAR